MSQYIYIYHLHLSSNKNTGLLKRQKYYSSVNSASIGFTMAECEFLILDQKLKSQY